MSDLPKESILASRTRLNRGKPAVEESENVKPAKDAFQLRMEIQVLAKDMGPLFATFLKKHGPEVEEAFKADTLSAAIRKVNELALKIAQEFTTNKNPKTGEIRPFRHHAAIIIAETWLHTNLEDINTSEISKQFGNAFHQVDKDLDKNLFKEQQITTQGTITMTAANVTAALLQPVLTYSFKMNPHELLCSLAQSVAEQTIICSNNALPEGSSEDDRKNIAQTFANQLTMIMVKLYEHKAREVAISVSKLPPAEKQGFFQDYTPIPDLTANFNRACEEFTAITRELAGTIDNWSFVMPSNQETIKNALIK